MAENQRDEHNQDFQITDWDDTELAHAYDEAMQLHFERRPFCFEKQGSVRKDFQKKDWDDELVPAFNARMQIKEKKGKKIKDDRESARKQIESEVESTVGSVCHHADKRGRKKSRGNPNDKRDAVHPSPSYNTIIQYPSPYYVTPPPGAQVIPPLNNESAGIAPLLTAWYLAGYSSGLYAAQKGRESCAQVPRPRGCNHCHCANSL